jgi:Ca2+-binding RTX toxin-like protein
LQSGDIDQASQVTLTSDYISANDADTSEAQDTFTIDLDAVEEDGLPEVAPENVKRAGEPGSSPITTSGKTVSQWLIGSAGNDELAGGSAADIINGDGGRNRLFGNEGNDVIFNVGTMGPRTFVINAIADGGGWR